MATLTIYDTDNEPAGGTMKLVLEGNGNTLILSAATYGKGGLFINADHAKRQLDWFVRLFKAIAGDQPIQFPDL